MQHFILTRLATGKPKESWLNYRLKIFEEYCVPSVAKQSCQSFTWLLAVHPNTPGWFLEKVEEICPFAKLVYFDKLSIYPNWKQIVDEHFSGGALLTTRLDSDDALDTDFVKEVQKIAILRKSDAIIDFVNGYKLDQGNLQCYPFAAESNHFISLVEFATTQTVFTKPHKDLFKYYERIIWQGNKPMWVEGINNINVFNNFDSKQETILWDTIKHNFS